MDRTERPASFDGLSCNSQHRPDLVDRRRHLHRRVESGFRYPDDMTPDELGAFARAIIPILEAALPFQRGPAIEAVARQPREDLLEIDGAVAGTAKPAGALRPILIPAIHAAARRHPILGVLDVKSLDPRMVDIDEAEI